MNKHLEKRERQRRRLHDTLQDRGYLPADAPAGLVGQTFDGRLIVRGVTIKGHPIDVGVPEGLVSFTPFGLHRAVEMGRNFAAGLQLEPSGSTAHGAA